MSSQILREIRDIEFSKLKELNLFSNKLMSIEGLHRVWMPALRDLDLGKH